jgi:recombinational DNA repair protein (RecF pathway)
MCSTGEEVSKFTRTQAFVLRRTNYGEADRILNLITPLGQISAIARGARKSKSKLAGGIEMLSLVELVLVEGRGDLKTVTSARLLRFFDVILSDYDRLTFAHLVFKQIGRASRETEGSEWFVIVKQVLEALNRPMVNFDLIQAWFYLRLTSELGEALNLVNDIDGQILMAEVKYDYDLENRGLVVSVSGSLTVEHIKVLRLLLASPLEIVLKVKNIANLSPVVLSIARAHAAIN